jgi:hypothetical protein
MNEVSSIDKKLRIYHFVLQEYFLVLEHVQVVVPLTLEKDVLTPMYFQSLPLLIA